MLLARSETQIGCYMGKSWLFTIIFTNGSQDETIEFFTMYVAGLMLSALLCTELESTVPTSML